MKKSRKVYAFFISMISVLVTTLTLSVGVAISLFTKSASGNGTYGEVSLRSYYECGSGRPPKTLGPNDPGDPFVITRPRHLYNLSRLHGLGVYGDKTYFQLGKEDLGGVDSNGVPMCYASDDPDAAIIPYLDMSGSDQNTNPINAVGSEALPFYGIFDGQNVEIKDLNVYANPQDAGLFGYTAHGSVVQNLFLSNITIHALGYTSDYADLYGANSQIGNDAYFVYDPNNTTSTVNINSSYTNTIYTYFYANNLTDFEYTPTGSSPTPTIAIHSPRNGYTYSSLLSGDLITTNEDNEIIPNLTRLFQFFKEKKNEEGAKFPIQATSTASLIVSSVDGYGQKHSKVLLTLEFDFSYYSATSDFISMGVRLGSDHGNNIGLVAGHCDGTVSDCYVYNGAFEMNGGGNSYNKLANGSDLGLIGHVGGTVQNILADDADYGAKEGKNIGVLDFTTIYNEIIDTTKYVCQNCGYVYDETVGEPNNNIDAGTKFRDLPDNYVCAGANCNKGKSFFVAYSFNGSHAASGVSDGVTFNPASTADEEYEKYLRNYDDQYITLRQDSVSFAGRKVISNKDLGVFTIATDPETLDGVSSGRFLDRSVILSEAKEDLTYNNDYYIYYSTGEYNKQYQDTYGGSTITNYLDDYNTRNNNHLLAGYYIPSKDQVTRDSFITREGRQNYFLRFKLNPDRLNKGFYLCDVDKDTDSGAFFANYFNYKLVDEDGNHIPVNDNKCGLMLKDNLRNEISSFSASFGLPDLYYAGSGQYRYPYCLQDADGNNCVGNMINFEVKTKYANVTVIAAPTDANKGAALGVYKLNSNEFSGSISDYSLKYNRLSNEPDYAFFMPTKSNLAYFDYQYNPSTNKGEVGTYVNGTFIPGSRKATVPAEYGVSESLYSSGTTRLFAHTFCLPKGRYCIGSASKPDQSVPKVYYLCAQGQDNGQLDFDDTVFASDDRVENVDFINVARFATNGTPQITIDNTITDYDPDDPDTGDNLLNRRLYVALVNSRRSTFKNEYCYISFIYDTDSGKFIISSVKENQDTKNAITFIAVDNYNHSLGSPPGTPTKELTISLIGNQSSGQVIVYPTDS